LALIALLAVGAWLIGPPSVDAQTPPWQQPPASWSRGAGGCRSGCASEAAAPVASDGPSCGDCSEGGSCGCGDGGECLGDLIFGPSCRLTMPHCAWFRADALLWWTKGGDTPPLLTTSPAGTSQRQAGVLGAPGTTVLFGDQELNNDLRGGVRLSFGAWLDACDNLGIEFTYLGLGQGAQNYEANSTGNPILARPYFDADTGKQDSHLIAYPNVVEGSFLCSSTSDFQAAEAVAHWVIVRSCDSRIELLGGYRYQRLSDGLEITDTANYLSPSARIQVFDQFRTQNDFNGGEVGVALHRQSCRWSLDTNLKLALGSTRSRVAINGSTTTAAGTLPGGLLALPSNSDVYYADQFSVVPELGVTLGYQLTCHLRATLGYTFLYWSNVARPGDQIDLNVSPSQFPGPEQQTADRPAFVQHNSDFWAQGITVGFDYQF
jgi:hypothetical protein